MKKHNAKRADFQSAIDKAPLVDTWPELTPLESDVGEESPYPLDALPKVAGNAVQNYQQYGQQPMSLVACSALTAMCYATQGLADVARDNFLKSPLSLNIMVVAESGERKSASDRIFTREAQQWEREQADKRMAEVQEANEALALFAEKEKALLSTVRRYTDKPNKQDDLSRAEHALIELRKNKPKALLPFQAFYEDTNQQTLAVHLADGHPVAGLISDEAGIVIGGNGMNHENALQFLAFGNRMWDGAPYKRNRLTTQNAWLIGRRLNCSLMMQQSVLQELLGIKDGQSRGTGFLARALFTQPASTKGTRLYKEPPNISFMEPFNQRIRALLELPLPVEDETTMRLNPPLLHLSAEAKGFWVTYHDQVEKELGAAGIFASVDDFAAKSAENAARIAGIFHVFEKGAQGEIEALTMQRSIAVASWHLQETLRVFSAMAEADEDKNARTLLKWLIARPCDDFSTADIGQRAPKSIRKKDCWEAALKLLSEHGYVLKDPAKDTLYRLNPKARVLA